MSDLLMSAQIQLHTVLADGELKNMKPDYEFMPFNQMIINVVQGMQGTALYVLAGLFVLAALCAGLGHFLIKSAMMRNIGLGLLVTIVILAALIANAGAFIDWGSGQILFH